VREDGAKVGKQAPLGDALENAQDNKHGRPRDVTTLDVSLAHVTKAARLRHSRSAT